MKRFAMALMVAAMMPMAHAGSYFPAPHLVWDGDGMQSSFTPNVYAAKYVWNGSAWIAATTTGTGIAPSFQNNNNQPNAYFGSMVYNTTTGSWQPDTGGGGGTSGVSSFNSRTGAVSPAANDYNFTQLAGTASATQLPAATPTTQGAVILPAGAANNTLARSATVDATKAQNTVRDISLLTPNLGSFPITVPTTTIFCFDGDSTTAGGQGSPTTSPISTIFRNTPIGAAVYANGATHIANYAVAGQNQATINARWSTSCHLVRPGVTLGDGTVVGAAYFVYWSYWNSESTSPAGNINRTMQEYAFAKSDGFIVIGATAMQDPSQNAGTEPLRQQFNAQLRAMKNFYNTTTVSACVTATLCGYDYLNDLDALIPELKTPFQTNGDGVTINYNLVASDLRHPSDVAAYLEMYNLNNILLMGGDQLPKGAIRPYGEVASTSATTAIPPFASVATITLAANYSPTFAAPPNPLSTPRECVQFVQDATGGRTVTWPANVLGGFTVSATASKRSMQCFVWTPSQTAWVAESPGIANY